MSRAVPKHAKLHARSCRKNHPLHHQKRAATIHDGLYDTYNRNECRVTIQSGSLIPMEKQAFHVAIIGGGIGGLCLAQGLKKAGISVAVYERDHSRTARLQGYRIHINPKGSRALYECLPQHLYDVFLATCGKSDKGFNFFTEQMKELLYVGADDMGIKTEPDPIDSHKSVSRFSLRQVLLTGLEEIVHFNKQFTRYEETPDGKMRACFEDGTSITCDVLIGAEGGNSQVRKQFLPH